MDIEVTPLPEVQRMYVYAQSTQISSQCGLIGYLRADMDTDGKGFYSSWFGFRDDLKTDEFKAEFDEVINALRFDERCGGLLKSRGDMQRYCRSNPESGFDGSCCKEYGFRLNTENHAYLMRLNPTKGDYNLYCYCYRRDWLDRHLKDAEKGIRFIDSHYKEKFRIADGEKVRIVTAQGEYQDRAARYIDDYHVELGSGFGDNIYHICELAERLENSGCKEIIPLRNSLPEHCYSMLLDTGKIVLLKKGETGFYPTDISFTAKEEARTFVTEQNSRLGVTRAQEEAMKAGSMFGFGCPAADPKNYDEKGTPVKSGYKERGDAR